MFNSCSFLLRVEYSCGTLGRQKDLIQYMIHHKSSLYVEEAMFGGAKVRCFMSILGSARIFAQTITLGVDQLCHVFLPFLNPPPSRPFVWQKGSRDLSTQPVTSFGKSNLIQGVFLGDLKHTKDLRRL